MPIPGQIKCGWLGGKAHCRSALFTAELFFGFFFSLPNKILPETVNMPEASLRGETDGTEELSVLHDYLLLPSMNSEQIRASSKNQHIVSPQHQLFLLPAFFSPSTHPLSPRVHPRLSKVCKDFGCWEEDLDISCIFWLCMESLGGKLSHGCAHGTSLPFLHPCPSQKGKLCFCCGSGLHNLINPSSKLCLYK